MSAESCGPPVGIVLAPPKTAKEEYNPELAWTDRSKMILKKVRLKEPEYSPSTIKELYNKAYKMGLFDEQD